MQRYHAEWLLKKMWDIRMERKQKCLRNTELEVEYEDAKWTEAVQNKVSCWAFFMTVMNGTIIDGNLTSSGCKNILTPLWG